MTRVIRGAILIFALLASGESQAGKAIRGGVILIENAGSRSIYNLYAVEEAGKNRHRGWGRDRLDDATIPAGRSREVTLFHRPKICLYRVRLVLAGGGQVVRAIDICRGGHWKIDANADRFEPKPAD
jgi:hypothetical protein